MNFAENVDCSPYGSQLNINNCHISNSNGHVVKINLASDQKNISLAWSWISIWMVSFRPLFYLIFLNLSMFNACQTKLDHLKIFEKYQALILSIQKIHLNQKVGISHCHRVIRYISSDDLHFRESIPTISFYEFINCKKTSY